MCLVIAAPHIRDSPGIAEDARGDPFPAKLALIAERCNAPGGSRVGGELVLEPCFFLDDRQPVDALITHRSVDLAGCETRPKLSAHLLAIPAIDCLPG
jgi:hypothetical protein